MSKITDKMARILKSAATQDGCPSSKNDCEILLSRWRNGMLFRSKGGTLKNGPAPFHYFTTQALADAFEKRNKAKKPAGAVKLWNLPVPVVVSKTILRKLVQNSAPVAMPPSVQQIKCASPAYTPLVPSRDLSATPTMRAVRCNAEVTA